MNDHGRVEVVEIALADEPPFRLGVLDVRPASLEVVHDGVCHSLERRVMQVLVALARRRGEVVAREALMRAGWGERVVGEDALHRCIVRLRRLGHETAAFSLENIPRVGYRLAETGAPARGAPEGQRHERARRILLVAAGISAVIVGGSAAWRLSVDASAPPTWQNGRVEVIRFEPLQADPGLRGSAVALGDAVVRLLSSAGVQTVQRQVGREAGGDPAAEFRIAGTVDRNAAYYVVNAQIVDRRSGEVLWSDRFDRRMADATGFEEATAYRIGDTLYCAMGSRSASREPMSARIFSLFLNACAVRRPPEGHSPRFFEVTRRLTQTAPDLSVAHSLHAVAGAVMATTSEPAVAGEFLKATQAAAARALELDPRNGEAYFALGISLGEGAAWLERERNYILAAKLSPNLSVVRNYHVNLMREVGRITEGRELNGQTAARDPFSPTQVHNLALARAAVGDREGAERLLQRLDLIRPDIALEARTSIRVWRTTPQDGLREVLDSNRNDPSLGCLKTHLETVARGVAVRGLPSSCRLVRPDWRVRMLARQGDVDGAYAELARSPQALRNTAWLFYSEMKAFRADPRFMPLVARLGLVDYWRSSGHWPDFCVGPSRELDCAAAVAVVKA